MSLRIPTLGLILLAISALSGMTTACSTNSQTLGQASSPTLMGDMKGMDHGNMGGMSHGMSMDLGPADGEYDLRFIDGMIPHHWGAIDMAKEALQKSKRPEIKALAQKIIRAQNHEENDLMRKWRPAWYPKASSEPVAYDSQQGKTVPMSKDKKDSMMMKMDLGAVDSQFDLRFLNAMIPHHQGAVVMAKDALTKAKHPELKQLAKEIVASQQAEIDQMQGLRKAWYGK